MDVRCRKCAEPIEIDEFWAIAEDEHTTFNAIRDRFASKGCAGIGYTCNENVDGELAAVSGALFDLLGDDIDGIGAMLEDWEYIRG